MGQLTEFNISKSAIPKNTKILIVDDEVDTINEIIKQLQDEGLKCVSAFNTIQGLDMVREDTEIGIVVTDIHMPGIDGLEMARCLNNDYGDQRDLFVIVVTGHADMKEAIEALQLGAEDFLTKPISPGHLLHSIRRAEEMIHLRANDRFYQGHLVTDLVERNKELNQKNQELSVINNLKDEFLQRMSHELKMPLHAIVGFSQLLKESSRDRNDENDKKCADHIYSAGMRLTKTVDSIFTLSALSAGDLILTRSRFSVQNFVDSIAADYTRVLAEWNAELHCELPKRPFTMNADFQELQKAIGHLIENAAKYGHDGVNVSLSINCEGEQVHISVSDDGPGMTPEQATIAIKPMRKIEGTVNRKFEGMGLGLPLASGVAELHGGQMMIESNPEKGTTVTISVPTAP